MLLFAFGGMTVDASADEGAEVTVTSDGIIVTAASDEVTYIMLRVVGPGGDLVGEQSSDGEQIFWSSSGRQDGLYKWEVRTGNAAIKISRVETRASKTRTRPWRESGAVTIEGGAIVLPTETEEEDLLGSILSGATRVLAKLMDLTATPAYADQVILDDLIVDGSLAVGFDAVNGESFGFDTIRLKENNLQIHFQDTSTLDRYPTNDWRIIINDSNDGGAGYFAVEDTDCGRVPFRIESGAPANSLYVEDYGRIGIGTATPDEDLHIAYGDTPTIRLDQDGTVGWSPQVWDIAGNESNFFIRDVTNGSKLSFRIQPSTPENTLTLKSTGYVGIGTWDPTAKLHVAGDALVEGNLEVGSSRELKDNIQALAAGEAMETLKALRPVKFNYKTEPNEESIGFIAEEVPDLVATSSRKSLSSMDMVAVLARVAQEQQKLIESLSQRIVELEKEPNGSY